MHKKITPIVLMVIAVAAIGGYFARQKYSVPATGQNQKKLVAPDAPALSYAPSPPSPKAYIQITWNYYVANYFNIYRSTDQINWQKIQGNYPQIGHAAMDSDFPKGAKTLYYRITSADGKGNESHPSPTTSVNLDETADWKTYKNDEYGFEFGYPVLWEIINYPSNAYGIGFVLQASDYSGLKIITFKIKQQTLKQYLEAGDKVNQTAYEGSPSKTILSTKEITVANFPAIQREESWLAAGFTTIVTYLKKDDIVYSFQLQVNSSGIFTASDQITYNKILSTFKFIQ